MSGELKSVLAFMDEIKKTDYIGWSEIWIFAKSNHFGGENDVLTCFLMAISDYKERQDELKKAE